MPPQALSKISEETANALVYSYIDHVKQQNELSRDIFSHTKDNKINERKHGTARYTLALFCVIGIIALCIFTDNNALLEKLIPLGAMLFGGTGIGIYYMFRRFNPKNQPVIKISEDDD